MRHRPRSYLYTTTKAIAQEQGIDIHNWELRVTKVVADLRLGIGKSTSGLGVKFAAARRWMMRGVRCACVLTNYTCRYGKRGIRSCQRCSWALWWPKHGILVDGSGQGNDVLLTASDETAGRISILWTKTAAEKALMKGIIYIS